MRFKFHRTNFSLHEIGLYSAPCFQATIIYTLLDLHARFSHMVLRLVRARVCPLFCSLLFQRSYVVWKLPLFPSGSGRRFSDLSGRGAQSLFVVVKECMAYFPIGLTHSYWMSIATPAIDEEMSAQNLNRVSESLRRRESISLLPSLEPIMEVDEEEDHEEESRKGAVIMSITTISSPPNWQLGPPKPSGKRIFIWFCCQCGKGGHMVNYVVQCLECFHSRCGDCPVERTK